MKGNNMNLKNIIRVTVLVATVGILAGCSTSTPPTTADTTGAVVIDVRTSEEFAGGHLAGSTNIDINAASFEERISLLDRDGKFFVYCRSGNRSAQAVQRMQTLGFTDVVDLGSVDSASAATGLDVIR